MKEPILDGKKILAVDDEPDVLQVLKEEILDACETCQFDEARTFEEAKEKIEKNDYDIVILDIMGVRGFDLLEMAVKKNLRVVMLTAHSLNSDSLKRSYEMKARAYLPKNKLGEIVPFLKDVLTSEYESGWRKILKKLEKFFDEEFEPDWRRKIGY